MNPHQPSVRRLVGRFAPSPTGPLHFGSLLAALASCLDARALGASWHVRMEDIDTPRCKPEFEVSILRTLERFGLQWDGEVVRQSSRVALYDEALVTLARAGLTYACRCSRKEIADSSTDGIEGAVYAGTCVGRQLPSDGNATRIKTNARAVQFIDRVQGQQRQQLDTEIGDFVVKRRDGLFAYQLAVVVDDHQQGVTHVVRGADLLASTARQIYLQQCLGYATPQYLHHPVITAALGQKLSKQNLATPVDDVGAPAEVLRRALSLLCQNVSDLAEASPTEILEQAIIRWDTTHIPVVSGVDFEATSD